jgi:hypothetical protein
MKQAAKKTKVSSSPKYNQNGQAASIPFVLYHGTIERYAQGILSKGFALNVAQEHKLIAANAEIKAVYLSTTPDVAGFYGKSVLAVSLRRGAKILDTTGRPNDADYMQGYLRAAEAAGYDGIYNDDLREMAILRPEVLEVNSVDSPYRPHAAA